MKTKMKIKREIEVTLIMDEDEAQCLKSLFQYPLKEKESEKDREMRTTIFNTIPVETKPL